MKYNIRFVLKNPKAVERTAINMIFSWGYKDTNGKYRALKYATGQSINPNYWDNEKQLADGSYSKNINAELTSLRGQAEKLFLRLEDDLTPSLFKSELDIKLGRVETNVVERKRSDSLLVRNYIDKYISDIETGKRKTLRNPLKRMSPGTIRNIKAFRTKFTDYEKVSGKSYKFEHINMEFYSKFINWLGGQHTVNSAGKTIKQLKTIMQASLDEGLHSNVEFKKKTFKVTSELVDTIYLTEDEIQQLYEKDLSDMPHYDRARDLFLIGCFSLQRISDWHKINKDNIDVTPQGTRIIKIKQQKGDNPVTIPLLSPRFIKILEKYDYYPPKMPDQKVNDYIKIICKDPEDYKGERTTLDEKASEIGSHTGRRSGCTNLYRAGIQIGKIMKVSGHKTESEFKKYIRVTDEEVADDLASLDYFKR